MEENSVQSIIDALADMDRRKVPVDPATHMEAAVKINVLLQGELEKLAEMESALKKIRAGYVEDGKSVASATVLMEASDEWLSWKKQQALVDTAIEQSRLSKKNAGLISDMMRHNL